MKYLSFLLGISLLFLSSCQVPNIPSESSVNADMDISFDDYFVDYVPVEENRAEAVHADKLIAFTFDDGPSKTMESLLALFAEFNESHSTNQATATFFLNGIHMLADTFPTLHAALALGMELGNHTQNHLDLTTLSPVQLTEEIEETERLLRSIDGQSSHLLRPPYGNGNDAVKQAANAPLIHWTIDTLDWTGASADAIYERVWKNRFSGAIVLMHDGYTHTVSALKRLLPDLAADGYQAVSVSEMARMHNCTLKNGSSYIQLRKQTAD